MLAVMGILSMKISASKVPMEVSKMAIGLDDACAESALIAGRWMRAARCCTARPARAEPEARRLAGRMALAMVAAAAIIFGCSGCRYVHARRRED